jgi:hypothetical protein
MHYWETLNVFTFADDKKKIDSSFYEQLCFLRLPKLH